jgi:hypothetical protein
MMRAKVACEWADFNSGKTGDDECTHKEYDEVKAAVYKACAAKEGLLSQIDLDKVKRETWFLLGQPKEGETTREVGSDPDREFQANYRKALRRHTREHVLGWLEQRTKISAAEPVAA